MPDPLDVLHEKIDALTAPDGDFAVVCPLSGKRPVPVRGKSFASAADAEAAVDLVRAYRSVLREVDPSLEAIPIVAVEADARPLRFESRERARSRWRRHSNSISLSGDGDGEWLRIDGAPVVYIRNDGELLSDAAVSRQLRSI